MHVLVIDGKRLAEPLRRAGHVVTLASGSEAAIATAQGTQCDAIVLEARPGSSGLTACADLRRACARTPILLIVARDTPEIRINGLDAGADDCISETCSFPELLARLRALARRAQPLDPLPRHVQVAPGDREGS